MRAPSQAAIERLRSQLRGAVLCQPDSGYEETRRVWNGMIDRQPLLIARCLGLADVVESVRFAREHDLPLTIRGGGHGVSGKAVMDGAGTADLSPMKNVQVDPVRRRAEAKARLPWGRFDPRAPDYRL